MATDQGDGLAAAAWPYEDPRFSTTHSEFEITNGQQWQWHVAPDIDGFHVHALTSQAGAMYALASGWRGRLYRSSDQGQHWELLYEHPTPEQEVSRITAMVGLDNTLYMGLTAWAEAGVKLLRLAEKGIQPVPGWPAGGSIGAVTAFQGRIYAVNRTDDTQRLWRSNGQSAAEPVPELDGYTVYALAALGSDLPRRRWRRRYTTLTAPWALGTIRRIGTTSWPNSSLWP